MLKRFITNLHISTKRNYLARMNDDKIKCMQEAKKYGKNYWDGNRRFGYGGYKYIPGRWKPVAEKLIKTYKLKANSKVLDVGCGKGFLLYEMIKIQPKLKIYGFDISSYALKRSIKNKRIKMFAHDARKKILFNNKFFDLAISINTLHNLQVYDLHNSIKEISRVSKKSFICVESYRNERELFNLQCWALTCQSFYNAEEWKWLFKNYNYKGDYEFIYFK
jgi:ubiquinone/menaquinone biosynthesis C-methylase UbiE